jgi:hypothetical protein
MSWGYLLLVLTSLCGAAVTTYLLLQSLKYLKQSLGSLTPEARRRSAWMLLRTWGSMLVAAVLITVAYRWGAANWGTRVGAAIAICAFAAVLIATFVIFGVMLQGEARQAVERKTAGPAE